MLAQAANSKDLLHKPGHWEIRHQLASFFMSTGHIQTQVVHIPRDSNRRAHTCAARANLIDAGPYMVCNSTTHLADHCPMLAKLGDLDMQDCKLISVTCSSC